MRRPLYQYSDYYSLGFAYDWSKPPSAVYFEFQELYGGVDAIDLFRQGTYKDWNYSAQVYYGTGSGEGDFIGQPMKYDTKNNLGLGHRCGQRSLHGTIGGYHSADYSIINDELGQAVAGLTALGVTEFSDQVALQDQHAEFMSLSSAVFFLDNWKLFGEYAEMTSPDTLWMSFASWYAGVQKSIGDYTVNYTYGRQGGDATEDYATPIRVTASQL